MTDYQLITDKLTMTDYQLITDKLRQGEGGMQVLGLAQGAKQSHAGPDYGSN